MMGVSAEITAEAEGESGGEADSAMGCPGTSSGAPAAASREEGHPIAEGYSYSSRRKSYSKYDQVTEYQERLLQVQ